MIRKASETNAYPNISGTIKISRPWKKTTSGAAELSNQEGIV